MRTPVSHARPRTKQHTHTLFEYEALTYDELDVEPDSRGLRELEHRNESAGAELVELGRTRLRATQVDARSNESTALATAIRPNKCST